MKLEPESLNIQIPPSFTWRSQLLFILASALLSLYVVWPTSIAIALTTLAVGTPLFWFIFGSGMLQRLTAGLPRPIPFLVVLVGVYAVAKLLLWFLECFAVLWSS
jgi:hypothetical protein